MAMDSKDLSVLAYSNGFTLWHYRTKDGAEAVEGEGYFDKVANIFNPGDLIFVSAGGAARARMYAVDSTESGAVAVGRMA